MNFQSNDKKKQRNEWSLLFKLLLSHYSFLLSRFKTKSTIGHTANFLTGNFLRYVKFVTDCSRKKKKAKRREENKVFFYCAPNKRIIMGRKLRCFVSWTILIHMSKKFQTYKKSISFTVEKIERNGRCVN